ncbi:MAG: NAD-dependent epimerase/dehydratase family protein, partial [Ignavibacteria bacterium]|nr:NAD-dependent epimerase/dehydratase family protein [Ignavibacteria bacterium]
MKTAIVIGATGLVGNFITRKLLDDNRYVKVKVFVRRSLHISNPKLEEHLINFDNIDVWKEYITGDELYSALGTTIKKAGSKDAQYKIDFTYQYEVAKASAQNRVK